MKAPKSPCPKDNRTDEDVIRNSWPASLDSIPLIRKHITAEAAKSGADQKTALQLGLALEEVTVNIVKYAFRDNRGQDIEIGIAKRPLIMIIHVIDKGGPFNPMESPVPDTQAPVEDRPIGGLGLFLVKKIVDEITYERDGDRNHLTLVKAFDKGE